MEDEKTIRCWIHPLLMEELKIWKEDLEEETGYKINGAMPIVSKLVALELRELRLKDKKNIKIELHKIKGMKKNEVIFP